MIFSEAPAGGIAFPDRREQPIDISGAGKPLLQDQPEALELILRSFHRAFQRSLGTLLIGGAREPLYIPSSPSFSWHRIFFVGSSVSSALHEVAHWCLAGSVRRQCVDYGYWYFQEGRSADQQIEFAKAEVRPQALESIFHAALGLAFEVSLDNFTSDAWMARDAFRREVASAAHNMMERGLPPRAGLFLESLQ